jgi:hypothetical protein
MLDQGRRRPALVAALRPDEVLHPLYEIVVPLLPGFELLGSADRLALAQAGELLLRPARRLRTGSPSGFASRIVMRPDFPIVVVMTGSPMAVARSVATCSSSANVSSSTRGA